MNKNEFLEEVKDLSKCAIQRSNDFLKSIDRDVCIDWDYDFESFDKNAIGVYENDSIHTGTMTIGMNINALWKVFKSETKNYPYTSEYKILQEMILTNVYHEVGHGICDYIEDILQYTDELDDVYDKNQQLFDNVLDNEENSVEGFAWSFYDNDLDSSDLYQILKLIYQTWLSESKIKTIIKENEDNLGCPIDCGEFDSEYNKPIIYNSFEYFGNCVNAWKIFGDVTTMGNFINSCSIVNTNEVIGKIKNGDKSIPRELFTTINKLVASNQINDRNLICSGINDYQKIMFIYLTNTDKHYFFDCD